MERDGKEGTLGSFDTVVLAAGAQPRNELGEEAKTKVKEVYVIGDAAEPRKGLNAIREGFEVGLKI